MVILTYFPLYTGSLRLYIYIIELQAEWNLAKDLKNKITVKSYCPDPNHFVKTIFKEKHWLLCSQFLVKILLVFFLCQSPFFVYLFPFNYFLNTAHKLCNNCIIIWIALHVRGSGKSHSFTSSWLSCKQIQSLIINKLAKIYIISFYDKIVWN